MTMTLGRALRVAGGRVPTASAASLSSHMSTTATTATIRSLTRPLAATTVTRVPTHHISNHFRRFTARAASMSFSNADTAGKTADPYVAKNQEEPDLKTKVEDLVAFAEKQKFCMLTTRVAKEGLLTSRAMALAAKEGNGVDFIFHTNTESGKTDDLASDPEVNIAFLSSSGEWASISGTADVITDRSFIHKHYSPTLKAWLGDLGDGTHDGGPDDPRIGAIKVRASTAQYAVSRRTAVGSAIEVVKGAITGETASVNKLRHLSEEELKQWRSS